MSTRTIILAILCFFAGYGNYCIAGLQNISDNGIKLSPRSKDFNNVDFKEEDGEIIIKTLDTDPFIFFDSQNPVDFDKQYMLSFESFNTAEPLPLVIFVGNQLDWDHLVEEYVLPRTEGWTSNGFDLSIIKKSPADPLISVRIRFGLNGGKTVRIRNVRLREPSELEKTAISKRDERLRQDAELSEHTMYRRR